MATTTTTTRVHKNPARKGKGKRRLSDKQIRYFGTARQKAALKARRAKGRKVAGRAKQHQKAARRPMMRTNPGEEILSIALNPGEKDVARSTTTKKKAGHGAKAQTRRPKKHNPARKFYGHKKGKRTKRHNPGVGGVGGLVTHALWIIGGAVGSKMLTQAVLGDKNKGVMGYAGNAISTFGLGLLVGKFLRNPAASNGVIAGGVVQIVLRAITDYTPFGKYAAQIGMGDYQVSNFVTPQRYTDALRSAEIEIPAGWAPRVIAPPAPAAGVSGLGASAPLYGGGGGGLY